MLSLTPGSYVLYGGTSTDKPLWPGVVIADDDAPSHVRDSRPQTGYRTLVLLIKRSYVFRWARTSELRPYQTGQRTFEQLTQAPADLQEAYAMTCSLIDAQVGLDYWREEVQTNFGVLARAEEEIAARNEAESMVLARQLTIEDQHGRTSYPSMLLAPSRSPPQGLQEAFDTITISDTEDEDTEGNRDLYSHPSLPTGRSHQSPTRTRRQSITPFPVKTNRASNSIDRQQTGPSSRVEQRSDQSLPLQADTQVNPERRRKGGAEVDSGITSDSEVESESGDVEMGDFHDFDMNGFITVYGGDPPEAFPIPTKDLIHRSYFRSTMGGNCYFEFDKKSNQMMLTHPGLSELTSQTLGYVLEFLTQESFKFLPSNEEDDPGSPFVQCGLAYEAADSLDMDDMIDHIADKLETEVQAWGMHEVLYFAAKLYARDVTPYEATERLRAMFVNYIIEHYDEYQDSDQYGDSFRKRLKDRRDLERAIQVRRLGLVVPEEE